MKPQEKSSKVHNGIRIKSTKKNLQERINILVSDPQFLRQDKNNAQLSTKKQRDSVQRYSMPVSSRWQGYFHFQGVASEHNL